MADGDANGPENAERQFNSEEYPMYVELARMSQESFFNRRSYEWKVAFGLWAAIGAITYFGVEKAEAFNPGTANWLLLLYIVIGGSWLVLWQFPLRLAFEDDKLYKHYYMHRAEGRSVTWPGDVERGWKELFGPQKNGRLAWDFRRTAWTFGQTFFTIAFLFGSWIAISTAIEQAPSGDAKVEVKASGGNVKLQTEASK